MKRREFLGVAIGSSAAASLSSFIPGCSIRSGGKRPNILFIMTDDHAAQAISCYGSKINTTPNIDRIAEEGMRFENCFCTNSICVPSRATILTGKYSHKNGCLTLADRFDGTQQTFPKLLQKAGYYTAIIGKWHLGSDPTGFDYWNILPGQGRYFDPEMIEMGERKKHEGYVTDIITYFTLDILKNRPKDKPFCLLYHHKAPHDLWSYDEKHADLFKDIDIPEPENLYDDYRSRGSAIKLTNQKIGQMHTLRLFEKDPMLLAPRERKRQAYQLFIKSYLRCVASVDDNIGRVLDYLDENGLRENTIVIYTSDQGVFLGEHGLFDKRFMYEESLRMPFIVRYPKEIKPGRLNKNIVLNVDFAETFLDYAGLPVPKDMQGHSLRPLFKEKIPEDWRTSMYYRFWMHLAHFGDAGTVAHFGVRTKRHKLIYYYGQALGASGAIDKPTPPEWELFDLEKDPMEMNNVYSDPEYAKITRDLKAELLRLRKELEDEDDVVISL
jgi:arylsulfatase A-like enzyme